MLPQTIHIESKQSVAFKTQVGERYGQNTRCKVFFKVSWAPAQCSLKLLLASFQKTRSCPALVMSCPKFDVPHPRANCRPNNGDYLSLGSRRFQHKCLLVESYLLSPQVLQEHRAKQLHLQGKQANPAIPVKQESPWGGCRVHHCLLRFHSKTRNKPCHLQTWR